MAVQRNTWQRERVRDVVLGNLDVETDDVAALVLQDNYEQAETLSLAEAQSASMLEVHQRFIRALESAAKLDRELESLPDEEELAERAREHKGLTRPELSVLLAFSKVFLYAALLDSDVPEDPHLSAELAHYFPPQLPEEYGEVMRSQRVIIEWHHLVGPEPRPRRSRAPTPSRARCSGCAPSGRRSRRSTTRSSPTSSSRCCSRAGA